MFSYGEKENCIRFNNNKITQLTAPNGSGKSSIALILQEVLFNKNIKSIEDINGLLPSKNHIKYEEFYFNYFLNIPFKTFFVILNF